MAKLKKYLVELTVSQQYVYEIEANNKFSAEVMAYRAYHNKDKTVQVTDPFLKLNHIVIKER